MIKNLISTFVLLILDLLWISLVMGKLYKKMIPQIQSAEMEVNNKYAILSYLTLVFAMNFYVIPNISTNNYKDLINHGFILGLIIYGVYDFTAAAVLKNWDKKTMVIDIIWGGILFYLTPLITNLIFELI